MKKITRALLAISIAVLATVSLFTFAACKCNHEWSEWTILTAATCETDGVQTRKCSKCDVEESEKIEAIGHDEIIDEAVEATCTETGLTEGKHCGRCDKVLVEQEVVKALGHEEVIDEAVAATCTETGLTEGKHCGRCNDVLIEQQVLPALGHNYVNSVCTNCNDDISTKGLLYAAGAEENTCVVAGIGTAVEKDVIIPGVHQGKKVVGIGNNAFYKCDKVTSVVIPDTVTSIGSSAFSYCRSLTSITLPNSVTSIGNDAFSVCNKLIEVKNLSSLPIAAGSNEYGGVAYNAKRVYKEGESYLSTDKDGYKVYDDGTKKILVGYVGTQTELTLPEGITEIYNDAFSGCSSLTSITLPNSVTNIGNSAFENCSSLVEILVEESNTSFKSIDGDLYTKDGKTFIQYAQGKKQTSFALAEGVTSIGERAFSGCSSLTSITLPNSVTSIGDWAFEVCSSLTQVNYKGTEEQWNKIQIGGGNSYLTSAKRNYI